MRSSRARSNSPSEKREREVRQRGERRDDKEHEKARGNHDETRGRVLRIREIFDSAKRC